jgi:hypothetical protein
MADKSVGCLLYADDVLILSQDATGLQTSLDKLNNYCKRWKLSVNVNKTKIMVFNCRKVTNIFKIGNHYLENTTRICYLGFVLTPSGKCRAMIKHLYDKASRALFALREKYKCIPYLSVDTHIKIFDTVVLPILMYGSEVWGAYIHKFKGNNFSFHYILQDVNSLFEKLHLKVCKQILHVQKSTNSFAVRFELGRLPLAVNIVCRILKYYVNISNRNENSIVKTALKLHMESENSWFTFVKYITDNTQFNLRSLTKNNITGYKNSILCQLKSISETVYKLKIAECNKLVLYSQIKVNIAREKYLNLRDANIRKSVSELRLSSHKLPIEVGRYRNLPRQARLCTLCNMAIGDEYHCLLECFDQNLTLIRNKYLTTIFQINPMLQKLSRKTLLKYILLFSDKSILKETAGYIHNISINYPKI